MNCFVLTTGGKIAEFVNDTDARLFARTVSSVAKNYGMWFEVWTMSGTHKGTFINGFATKMTNGEPT